mmetsp:Transcript_39941/g.79983  ORF Transcript_39941/g.79983 Transcript_39941/m.79983 type:complete len:208 (-) Transcript_39941:798-1421(-)
MYAVGSTAAGSSTDGDSPLGAVTDNQEESDDLLRGECCPCKPDPPDGFAPAMLASNRADCSALRMTAVVTLSRQVFNSSCVGAMSSRRPGRSISVRSLASRAASSACSSSMHVSTLRCASSSFRSALARAASMRLNSSSAFARSPCATSSAFFLPSTLLVPPYTLSASSRATRCCSSTQAIFSRCASRSSRSLTSSFSTSIAEVFRA